MRLRETIKIDDKEITVKELTVRDIRETWDMLGSLFNEMSIFDLEKTAPYFSRCVEGLKLEDIYDMAPSDLKKIMDAFKTVNAVFFEAGKNLEGENPLLAQMRQAIVATLIGKFVDSSRKAITEPGNTDGVSILPPSK